MSNVLKRVLPNLVKGLIALTIILVLIFCKSIIEVNNSGYYKVKQSIWGKMTTHTQEGPFFQNLGKITEYSLSDMTYFSKHDEDGGKGEDAAAVKVRFNDGGTAEISGSIKYRLSTKYDDQIKIHRDFRSYKAIKQDLMRQVVTEALMQTATLMKAEESYNTRRSEFTEITERQIKQGIFETEADELVVKDAEGNEFIERSVRLKEREVDGKKVKGEYVIRKISPLVRYNIEVLQFVIKDLDFDKIIDNLISKKKEAEQQKVVAKANAEKAKQDAITVEEQGKARIAEAKADKEVEKIAEVTQAMKAYEVAKYEALQANEIAKKITAEGATKAAANAALVRAGLTPIEKANIDKETAIGVAQALATWKGPSIVTTSGDKGSSPMDALFIKQMMDISKQLTQ